MSASRSVLCLSDWRWGCGRRRPQRLLSRCARERPVAVFEEPVFDASTPRLELVHGDDGVLVATPHLAPNTPRSLGDAALRRMLDRVVVELGDPRPVLWFYTPMPVGFSDHIDAAATVYDCTSDAARLTGASSERSDRERRLFARADVVFTDCYSLCRHKRATTGHANVHPFLSSVDVEQLALARERPPEPADQDEIPRPRVGFFGVIDERVDLRLLDAVARARPELSFVLVGPCINVDPSILRRPNVHWLGPKSRDRMPAYIGGWDVAMLPLVRGEATRFISPTKTAEYLAAGKPVVSTSIPDVAEPYGRAGLVWIGDGPGEFGEAIDQALASDRDARVAHADAYLSDHSWQNTWAGMWTHVEEAMRSGAALPSLRSAALRRTAQTGVALQATARR